MLSGRRVVLGVSGGVAAYKSAYLARRLLEAGAEVRVVMTPAAQRFIGAQTFASLTGSHPLTDLFEDPSVSPHTELARWAALAIVAPGSPTASPTTRWPPPSSPPGRRSSWRRRCTRRCGSIRLPAATSP